MALRNMGGFFQAFGEAGPISRDMVRQSMMDEAARRTNDISNGIAIRSEDRAAQLFPQQHAMLQAQIDRILAMNDPEKVRALAAAEHGGAYDPSNRDDMAEWLRAQGSAGTDVAIDQATRLGPVTRQQNFYDAAAGRAVAGMDATPQVMGPLLEAGGIAPGAAQSVTSGLEAPAALQRTQRDYAVEALRREAAQAAAMDPLAAERAGLENQSLRTTIDALNAQQQWRSQLSSVSQALIAAPKRGAEARRLAAEMARLRAIGVANQWIKEAR